MRGTWRWRVVVVAVIAAVGMGAAVQAGGWATVTLDAPVGNVEAGRPFDVGFVVKQHGVRPVDVDAALFATHSESGTRVAAVVRKATDGGPGHYQATLTLPATGTWTWTFETAPYGFVAEQSTPLPPIEALAPGTLTAPAADDGKIPYATPVSVAVLVLGLVAAGVLLRRERRSAHARRSGLSGSW